MKLDVHSVRRSFSSQVMERVFQTLDKGTMIAILIGWGVALTLLGMASYTVTLSVKARQEALAAIAAEPALPRIVTKAPETAELKRLVDRLQKRFPEISFAVTGKALGVSTKDVDSFRLWLTVLSYIDTVSPQYRWSIKEFCVGLRCEGGGPMHAILEPDKVTFTAPQSEE